MTHRTARLMVIVISLLVSGGAFAKSVPGASPTIVDLFLNEFKKKNANIDVVDILDTRWASSSKETGYVVVARGYRKEQRSFSGNWEDELFGFFVVDRRLSQILMKLDVVPTPRWHDYWYTVGQATWDEVTIEGVDGYGSTSLKKYNLKTVPWPGLTGREDR